VKFSKVIPFALKMIFGGFVLAIVFLLLYYEITDGDSGPQWIMLPIAMVFGYAKCFPIFFAPCLVLLVAPESNRFRIFINFIGPTFYLILTLFNLNDNRWENAVSISPSIGQLVASIIYPIIKRKSS